MIDIFNNTLAFNYKVLKTFQLNSNRNIHITRTDTDTYQKSENKLKEKVSKSYQPECFLTDRSWHCNFSKSTCSTFDKSSSKILKCFRNQ